MAECEQLDILSQSVGMGCTLTNIPKTPLAPTVLEGQSLYEAYNRLANIVNNMNTTYNNAVAAVYNEVENLKNVALTDGIFYDNESIIQSGEYDPAKQSFISTVRVKPCDRVGNPIRVKLGLAFNSFQNKTLVQDIWDFGIDTSAQVVMSALNNPQKYVAPGQQNYFGYTGIVIKDGYIVQESTDVKYSIGFKSDGNFEIYLNSDGASIMVNDGVVDSFGIGGVLVSGGVVSGDNILAEIPRYDSKQGRLALGITADGDILFVGNNGKEISDSVFGGFTSKELATYMLNLGAVKAVELCETAIGTPFGNTTIGFTNKGESLLGANFGQEGYSTGAFWYVSRQGEYTTESQKQIAGLYQAAGSTLGKIETLDVEVRAAMDNLTTEWSEFKYEINNKVNGLDTKLTTEISDREEADTEITNNLNAEIQNRKQADTTLQNNIDTLESKVDKEIQDRTAGDTALDQKITTETSEREAYETATDEKIDTIVSTVNKQAQNIQEIRTELIGYDNDLSKDISDLDTKYTGITNNLSTAISNEQTARIAKDNELEQKISEEVATRTEDVADLKAKDSEMESTFTSLYSQLNNSISSINTRVNDLEFTISRELTDSSTHLPTGWTFNTNQTTQTYLGKNRAIATYNSLYIEIAVNTETTTSTGFSLYSIFSSSVLNKFSDRTKCFLDCKIINVADKSVVPAAVQISNDTITIIPYKSFLLGTYYILLQGVTVNV